MDIPREDARGSKCVACSVTVREQRWASDHGTKEHCALTCKYKFTRDPWVVTLF